MGQAPRERPARLSEKLLQIRNDLGLSQNGIVKHLGLEEKVTREDISKFEIGTREPTLLMLLKYAKAVKVSTDVLIDDELDLPTSI
jgi:transcriptional regulator with XRE-family HTH domain